jgi:NTE family protein
MTTDFFLKNAEILDYVQKAEQIKASQKRFSDITDDQGNQYVDLVQEGGGVLGIALIGYTYILEKAGIRFFSLAGASAGALSTLFLASVEDITKSKSEKTLESIANMNFLDFVDGGSRIKRIVIRYAKNKPLLWPILFNMLHIYKKITILFGLNPGKSFEAWIRQQLAQNGVEKLSDLIQRTKSLPKLYYVSNGENKPADYDKFDIAIIATDTTTKTKVDFPRMASLYWDLTANDICPSAFVRASVSIPFFFEPFSVNHIPSQGESQNKAWQEMAGYDGTVPAEIKFVDGGLLSNFPINIFHKEGVPRKPTFGVRLSAYREQPANTKTFNGFVGGMFDAIRQQFDFDFLYRHPDYKHLICKIDADQSYNWLDFNISDQNKLGLFKLGAARAIEFLGKFNWEDYKQLRMNLSAKP